MAVITTAVRFRTALMLGLIVREKLSLMQLRVVLQSWTNRLQISQRGIAVFFPLVLCTPPPLSLPLSLHSSFHRSRSIYLHVRNPLWRTHCSWQESAHMSQFGGCKRTSLVEFKVQPLTNQFTGRYIVR